MTTTKRTSTLDIRRAEAHAARVEWQRHLNALAHRDGSWARLTREERQVLRDAAMGAIPEGIMEATQTVWMPDGPVLVESGYWTAEVPLVVNRGDYGFLAPDGTEWREEPIGLADDRNVFLIDPTSEFTLHDGLSPHPTSFKSVMTQLHPHLDSACRSTQRATTGNLRGGLPHAKCHSRPPLAVRKSGDTPERQFF